MELNDLNQETRTPRPKDLDDSQDILAESATNLSFNNSQDEGKVIPRAHSQKKRTKGKETFLNKYINLLFDNLKSSPINKKIIIIIALLIAIATFFIKITLYFIMIISLIKRIKKLHTFIFERILDDISYNYFYYFINYFFLIFGFIIYLIEIFCQFFIRYKTLLTINECSLKALILSKCLFFISLGLLPEVIFANIPFKSKQNIFLSFYKMKFLIQPYIILILIIYILFTICIRSEDTKTERIFQEIKLIKYLINDFVDKYVFVWNNFNETIKTEDKDKDKENEDSKERDNITSESDENKNNDTKKKQTVEFKKRNTMVVVDRNKGFGTIIKRKRKSSLDENEDKSKNKKFLDNDEEKDKKKFEFFKKIWGIANKVKSLWVDNIFTRIKRYIIFGIIIFILISPVINGIFGYGYYVFYESSATLCFQIELTLCFVFGFNLILLADN